MKADDAKCWLFAAGFLFFLTVSGPAGICEPGQQVATSQAHSLPLEDDSDWWSITKGSESLEGGTEQNRRISKKNFQILGIVLSEDLLERAATRLGPGSVIRRGDGGESRAQLCFVSKAGRTKTYLVFETGEVNDAYYLFQGPTWNGSKNCLPTELVNEEITTGAGLRLGVSTDQVTALLGQPSKRKEGEFLYLLGTKEKNTAEGLQKARKAYPQMTEKEILSSFAYYDLTVSVLLKFKESKLSYFGISKSETF